MGSLSSQIFITTIVATTMSSIAAVVAVKFLEKRKRFSIVNRGDV
jgi:spore maturation protein SpmA